MGLPLSWRPEPRGTVPRSTHAGIDDGAAREFTPIQENEERVTREAKVTPRETTGASNGEPRRHRGAPAARPVRELSHRAAHHGAAVRPDLPLAARDLLAPRRVLV